MTESFQFTDLQGETLIKKPGSINGESFTLRDLSDCTVFLLDYTSEVEVTNCTNCQIFVGPVDGPAIFDSCSNCQVAVACQQFQAKGCQRCEFGLYCATGPSISNSTAIKVSCWAGAYPGLTAHFQSANLDPSKNKWDRVYDASDDGDESPNFELLTTVNVWEVPVDDIDAPPENPVPNVNSSSSSTSVAAQIQDAFPTENGNHTITTNNNNTTATLPASSSDAINNQTSAEAAADYELEPPSTAVARNSLQQRLASQAKEETEKKVQIQQHAAHYLDSFYQQRNAARDERIAAGRDELKRRGSSEVGPEGNTLWERAISMIDFNMSRPSGSDLSRFKSVLFACKEKS